MKHIVKSPPPVEFEDWKKLTNDDWQPAWDYLRGTLKENLHKHLLAEQGHICCYCEVRISEGSSHIEHLKPRSSFPEDALNYQNFLASCQRDLKPGEPRHCGNLKGNWYDSNLMVSPLSSVCEDRFRYTGDGGICPQSDDNLAAKETISHLGLGIDKLRALRSKAIEPIINALDSLKNDEIDNLATGFQARNGDGEYAEFCTAIVYILRNYA